jgi:hypothetical protein
MLFTAQPWAFAEVINIGAAIVRAVKIRLFILGIPIGLQLRVAGINVVNIHLGMLRFTHQKVNMTKAIDDT